MTHGERWMQSGGRAGRAQQALDLKKEELAATKALMSRELDLTQRGQDLDAKAAADKAAPLLAAAESLRKQELMDTAYPWMKEGAVKKPAITGMMGDLYGSSDSAVSYGPLQSTSIGIQSGGAGSTEIGQSIAPSPIWEAGNSTVRTGTSITDRILKTPSFSGGGEIDGAPGDDQVAAEFSDGRPARLEDGEVVLPKEFVHQIGVAQLRKAVEAVTGKKMDPTVKEPLPGQGPQRVLAGSAGFGVLDAVNLGTSANPISWAVKAGLKPAIAGEGSNRPMPSAQGQAQLVQALVKQPPKQVGDSYSDRVKAQLAADDFNRGRAARQQGLTPTGGSEAYRRGIAPIPKPEVDFASLDRAMAKGGDLYKRRVAEVPATDASIPVQNKATMQPRIPLENGRGTPLIPRTSQSAEMMRKEGLGATDTGYSTLGERGFRRKANAVTREFSPVEKEIQLKEQAHNRAKAAVGPRNIEIAARQKLQDIGKSLDLEMEPDPVLTGQAKPTAQPTAQSGQASPNYAARAFKQTSEQDMLNKLAGEERSLSRKGNVFRYEDPAAMQPGVSEAQRAQNMQAIKDNPGYRHPMTGELIRGNASAMRAEGKRYDHLPISGVTFSDTVEGLKLGQKTPPAADAQTMEELRGLYKGMGKAQGAELEAPTVTEAERGGNVRTRKLMEARQQMLEAKAASLKPSDMLKAQRFEYDQGRDAAADERQSRLDREKKREYFMGDNSPQPPLGLDRAIYWGLIDEFSQAGVPEDNVITYLNSINDPKLEKALMKGELVSGDDGKKLTPLEMLKARMAASLEQQQ